MFLGFARIERGDLFLGSAGLVARGSALGEPRINRSGALAERLDHLGRHARNLEGGFLAWLDLVAKLGHAVRQFLPVDRANLLLQLIESARLETAPVAVLVLGRIENDAVGMQLRVLRPARCMAEGGNGEIAGRLAADLSIAPDPGGSHVPLDMGERHLHRLAMCGQQTGVACDLGHDRHRFGRGQGYIPSGPMLEFAVAGGAKLLTGNTAFEQFDKLFAVHFAGQAKLFRAFAQPFGRSETALGVIVIRLVIAGCLPGARQGRDRGDHYTGP